MKLLFCYSSIRLSVIWRIRYIFSIFLQIIRFFCKRRLFHVWALLTSHSHVTMFWMCASLVIQDLRLSSVTVALWPERTVTTFLWSLYRSVLNEECARSFLVNGNISDWTMYIIIVYKMNSSHFVLPPIIKRYPGPVGTCTSWGSEDVSVMLPFNSK